MKRKCPGDNQEECINSRCSDRHCDILHGFPSDGSTTSWAYIFHLILKKLKIL